MESAARVLDIFRGSGSSLYSQKDDCPKWKDPFLITIPFGGILIVNHPNIAFELTICAEGVIKGFIFSKRAPQIE